MGKLPWRRKSLPTPVFFPGEFHGERKPAGYSPRGCKELDTTERLNTHTHTHTILSEDIGRVDERERKKYSTIEEEDKHRILWTSLSS